MPGRDAYLDGLLESEIGPILTDAFPFAGRRCERLTETVMKRLGFSAD